MSSLADQVGQRVSGATEKVQERASSALATVQEKSAVAADSAKQVTTTLPEAVIESVRRRPLTTAAFSMAAGFLLGAMWKSTR